jgi:hypothetical protein
MLLLKHPEDRAEDVFESMAYYYSTGTCHCMGTGGGSTRATYGRATYCIASSGLLCGLSESASLELPTRSAPRDWVCAVRGGTGYLVLRPKIERRKNNNGARFKFTVIGVTSHELTSKILLSLQSQRVAGPPSESSETATIHYDWVLRAMEIIFA